MQEAWPQKVYIKDYGVSSQSTIPAIAYIQATFAVGLKVQFGDILKISDKLLAHLFAEFFRRSAQDH